MRKKWSLNNLNFSLGYGGDMAQATRILLIAILGMTFVSRASYAAEVDRAAVDFKTPSEIKWVRNAAGTNESAVLFGDPSKPGPYVMRLKWLPGNMSRPHFHPNDRFFVVLSGTWWVGTGEKFDPDNTVPMPAAVTSTTAAKFTTTAQRMKRPLFKSGAWDRRLPRPRKSLECGGKVLLRQK